MEGAFFGFEEQVEIFQALQDLRNMAAMFGHAPGVDKELHLVILQTLLSKATYNWGIHKAINLEEANRQGKCS